MHLDDHDESGEAIKERMARPRIQITSPLSDDLKGKLPISCQTCVGSFLSMDLNMKAKLLQLTDYNDRLLM